MPAVMLTIAAERPLVLGSGSPRRRDILESLGIPIVVRSAAVDERVLDAEMPAAYLERVVGLKLKAIRSALLDGLGGLGRGRLVLVADTIVVLDGAIVGKPADVEDAAATVRRLAGRVHQVMTRYQVAEVAGGGASVQRTVTSRVTLRPASDQEVRRYAETGEGLDKAGAYAAQGIGAFLVERIEGSYTNVIGLPACELVRDLLQQGWLAGFPGV